MAGSAAAEPAATCPPSAFATGRCDTLDAASSHAELKPITGLGGGLAPLAKDDAATPAISSTEPSDVAQGQDWSKWRAQDAGPSAVGGVPNIRPMGRPAVVVPILSF